MREPEKTKIPLCEELGIGLVAWGPLGLGFLTGKITRGAPMLIPETEGVTASSVSGVILHSPVMSERFGRTSTPSQNENTQTWKK